MAIVKHDAVNADLGIFVPKQTALDDGQVEATLEIWQSEDGLTSAGIWEASPGRFPASRPGYHEICQILAGSVTVTADGEDPIDLRAGDTLVTPAGWTGQWEIHEELRKTYIIVRLS